MKTCNIKSILTLLMVWVVMPPMAQDFMNIYFKNGDYRKFYMKNITEIAASMIDASGVQHSNYGYQCITTIHDKYTYRLEDVDSITFTKIDEKKAEQNFASAMSVALPDIIKCNNIEDAEQFIDDIKGADGVADAWSDGHMLYMKIDQGETISFHFSHDRGVSSLPSYETVRKNFQKIKRAAENNGNRLKFVIANQQHYDQDPERQQVIHDYYKPLLSMAYDECNMDTAYIPGPTIEFFYNGTSGIWQYDIIFVPAHGGYNEVTDCHFLATSEYIGAYYEDEGYTKEQGIEWNRKIQKIRSKYGDATDMQISIGTNKEVWGGRTVLVFHPGISQHFFENVVPSTVEFSNPNSIFFNAACHTLEANDNFADALLNRNLGLYWGYDLSNEKGPEAGYLYFMNMLSGKSSIKSYLDLPEDLRLEYSGTTEASSLQRRPITEDTRKLFIVPTITEPLTQEDATRQYSSSDEHYVIVKGTTTSREPEVLLYGFIYGEDEDLTNAKEAEDVDKIVLLHTTENGNVCFQGKIKKLEWGNTYFYRAYTWDGINYNYGDVCSFKIGEDEPAPEKIMMLSKTVRDATYDIYKVITDKDNYRTNPDGWKCYKSSLVLDITKNGQTTTYTIDDNIYLDAQDSHHGGQRPCMYFHFDGDEMFIFINSKDTQYSYTMNGYAYRTSLSNISFNRETVFSGYNWGWSPYFTHEDGALVLKHFSYAGYYAMTSYRNSNGTWSTQRGSYITPDEFDRQSEQAGDVFVADDNGSVANLQLSQTQVTLVEGNSCTVEITAGSGEYGVTNLGSDHAVATLQGTTITIVAVSAGDAQVVVTDMQSGQKVIIDISVTASGDALAYPSCPDGNHPHMIDLGLPSGVKWACCNIGSDKPEKAGEYYAWGETSPQWYVHSGHYSMDSSGTSGLWFSMTKYCIDSAQGTVDNKISLDLADDVAHKKLGGTKRMPSMDEMNELLSQCQLEKTTVNGANVCKFTGPNGNSIFLPTTGYWSYGELEYTGNTGEYWSRSLDLEFNHKARILYFSDYDDTQESSSERYKCKQVRAVMAPAVAGQTSLVDFKLASAFNFQINIGESKTITIQSGNGVYSATSKVEGLLTCAVNTSNIVVTGVSPGTTALTVTDKLSGQDIMLTVTVCPLAETPAEAIDLGLPSGTKWAAHNIGATAPEAAGSYFAWGETGEKSAFSWENYLYGRDDMDVDDIGKDIAGTVYDVASQKWGGSWRLPTDAQMSELIQYCTTEWTTVGGVNCQKVTGPNGKFIILPAAGTYYGGKKDGTGVVGYYWASEPFPTGMYSYIYDGGLNLYIGDDGIGQSGFERYAGCTVRPVTK